MFFYIPQPSSMFCFLFFWLVEKRPIWGRGYFCVQRKLKPLRVNSSSVLLHESKFIGNATYLSWRARRQRKVSLQLQKGRKEMFFQAKNGEKAHRLQEHYRQPSAPTNTLLGIITPGRWQVLPGKWLCAHTSEEDETHTGIQLVLPSSAKISVSHKKTWKQIAARI